MTPRNRNTCARVSLTDGVPASAGRPAQDVKTSRGARGLLLISGLAVVFLLVCGTAFFGFGGTAGQPEPMVMAVAEAPADPLTRPADPLKRVPPGTPGGYPRVPRMPDRVDRSKEVDPGPLPETTTQQSARAERLETEPAARGGGRWLAMLATAYTPDCGNGDGYTATMTRPRIGVIAVDPLVIPYKTLVYIEKYGYFRAEDTGADIKGNRIDIYMETRAEALEFGRRWVDVKVIGKIEE
ncbi:MAG: 3D domain-containing protein [Bacillota bacterium]